MEQFDVLKIFAYVPELSTRILLETSLDPTKYSVAFTLDREEFIMSVARRQHDIFLIDASAEKDMLALLKLCVSSQLKGLVRMLLLLDTVTPDGANQMQPYGPLCFLENFFTRERLNAVLKQIMDLRDTGVRVKADPKFFDITILSRSLENDNG